MVMVSSRKVRLKVIRRFIMVNFCMARGMAGEPKLMPMGPSMKATGLPTKEMVTVK